MYKHLDRQTESLMDRLKYGWTYRRTDRLAKRKTDRWTCNITYRQTDRDTQMSVWKDRQTDRQIEKRIDNKRIIVWMDE